jgi:hypothetical protein
MPSRWFKTPPLPSVSALHTISETYGFELDTSGTIRILTQAIVP